MFCRNKFGLSLLSVLVVYCLTGSISTSSGQQNSSFRTAAVPASTNRLGAHFDQQTKTNQGRSATQPDHKDIEQCSVQFLDDIELPALESGQVKSLAVKEGDAFSNGMQIGQIDDGLFQAMLAQANLRHELAQKKATDETSILASKKEVSLAGVEYQRTLRLYKKGSKSEAERDKAQFAYELAQLKKIAAENGQESAGIESQIEESRVKEVHERIRRHKLISNFDGYVIEIFRHPLEWVNAGEKVMRVARMDKLWVQGIVSSEDFNAHELMNKPVTVMLKLARNETTEFQGKIVYVSLERQTSTNYLVKAEIKNRPIEGHWVLQPNSNVTMRIHLKP